METSGSPVAHAHKLGDGILVYFVDGKIAFFSPSLLRGMLPYAIEFKKNADIDEEIGRSD
jgi:hypothetical protein